MEPGAALPEEQRPTLGGTPAACELPRRPRQPLGPGRTTRRWNRWPRSHTRPLSLGDTYTVSPTRLITSAAAAAAPRRERDSQQWVQQSTHPLDDWLKANSASVHPQAGALFDFPRVKSYSGLVYVHPCEQDDGIGGAKLFCTALPLPPTHYVNFNLHPSGAGVCIDSECVYGSEESDWRRILTVCVSSLY